MADFPYKELATAYAAALTIGAGACFYLTTYQLYDPDFAFAAKCLKIYSSEFVRLPFRFIVTLMGIALGVALTQTIVNRYNSSSTGDPQEQRCGTLTDPPDEATRKALKASSTQGKPYLDVCDYNLERLRQRAIELRDSKRTIQNQTAALERSEHRADAAERSLRQKIETIKFQSTAIELDNDRIRDHKNVIVLQAQHIRDTDRDVQAMAQQIEDRDQRLWEAAGNLTIAEQKITELQAAVANESTTSDYCCALDAIRRRDEAIYGLQQRLAQYAKDSEFNQETVDTLSTFLISLGDKSPVQAIRELEAWAEEREACFDDFATLSGPVVLAQQDACQRLRDTNDLQHKLLRNALETRDRQGKTVAEVKAQLADLVAREEANIKVYNQTMGEKQHLLNALNNSQNSLQAAKAELHRRGTELSAVHLELSHHMLQQAIDGKKKKVASNADAAQQAKLATLTSQIATLEQELQAADNSRVHEVAMMNAKVCMIREALKLTGLDVDLWTIESPDQLAAMLASDNQAQEAELAETCAELSATNSSLKTTLTAQTTELAALKIELTNSTARHHADFTSWQSTLAKVTTELKTTQRDSPSRDLQNKITALQLRLKLSQDDNAILTTAKSLAENKIADLKHCLTLRRDKIKTLENEKIDAEHKAEVLTMHVTDQAERLRVSRGCIDRCVQINNELREEVEGQGQQIGDLTGMLEEARAAWREENEEVQRLTWLVGGREEEVRVLEGVREGLEKRLLLGEEEFVEVSEGDVPAATAAVVGNVDEGKDGSIVVQGEEKDCSADEFEAVDVGEESVGDEFEEVEAIEGVEVDESADGSADKFEQVDVDENGEGL